VQRHDDLVWKLRRQEDDLYMLVEFQSRPEQSMAERMHAYTALLSDDLAKQHKSGAQILPIVLYSGRMRWRANTSIWTLSSQFSYRLVDRYSIRDRANIVSILLRLDRAEAKYDELQILLGELNFWLQGQSNAYLVQTIEALVRHKVHSAITRLPRAFNLEEVTEIMEQQFETYLDWLKFHYGRKERIKGMWEGRKHGRRIAREAALQEGRQEGCLEGRQEGRQEGIQIGQLETSREFIRILLQRNGTPLTAAANEDIERASLATLKAWCEMLVANEVPPELKH
jgi:predicted transposase/invertase (TIGR01784 family)